MKNLFIILSFTLFSGLAAAQGPDLAGEYECNGKTSKISQNGINYILEGVSSPVPMVDQMRQLQCTNDKRPFTVSGIESTTLFSHCSDLIIGEILQVSQENISGQIQISIVKVDPNHISVFMSMIMFKDGKIEESPPDTNVICTKKK